MIEALALVLSGYAGYAGWHWWIATIVGAIAGLWHSFGKARLLGVDFSDPDYASDPAFRHAAAVTPMIVLLVALLCTGIYFAFRLLLR